VVGVVGDVRHRALDRPPRPEAYVPHAQFLHFMERGQARAMTVVLRAQGDPAALAAPLREAVRGLDPAMPAGQARTMRDVVAASVSDRWRNLVLVATFAALALVLAAIGLHGVLAYTVAQRTREIGVRLALGASPSRVRWDVVGQGMRLLRAGLLCGAAAAVAASGTLRGLLFDIGPRDAGVFTATVALLALVGFAACWVPARRATTIDPATALRD
jgi:hypothetical protein